MINNEHQLQKIYKNKQLIEFISKQIQQLIYKTQLKIIRKIVCLSFSVPSKTNTYNLQIEAKAVDFILTLGKGFPCNAPKLHIKTWIVTPGFADCRDLVYDILKIQEWDYRITIKQIQQKIPQFLANLKPNPDVFQVSRIGQFHLNSVYPLDLLKQLQGNDIYYGFQYDSNNILKMYIIDISATHIVLFLTKQQPIYQNNTYKIPNQKDITSCMIVFYAELGSIVQIIVNRLNFNDVDIKFAARKPMNMHMTTTTLIKKLKLRKGTSLIQKIIRNIKNYNITEMKLQLNQQTIKKQQKQSINNILQAQKQLQHKFNSDSIHQLNNCYQHMVEYYSINGIPYFQIYIDKISKLFQRADVQLIMNSQQQQNQIKENIQLTKDTNQEKL